MIFMMDYYYDRLQDLRVYDESGTEIEEDVFEDLLKNPNCGILKLVSKDEIRKYSFFSPFFFLSLFPFERFFTC